MNKKLLNAALVLIPKKLQHKAIAKALNYLLPTPPSFGDKCDIRLTVSDLKKSWVLQVSDNQFQAAKHKKAVSDIVLSAPLAVVLSLDEPEKVIHAMENGLVTVEASEYNRTQLLVALQALSQERIDALIARCYGFLKLTPKPRLDLKTVTLSELMNSKDVDFVRDEAVKREKTDLTEALRLMELAHQARPDGPFIKKKVQEYRKALKGE